MDSYPEFWGGDAGKYTDGHYLAIEVAEAKVKGNTVTAQISEAIVPGKITLEDDGIFVCYIQNTSQTITVEVDNGKKKNTKVLSLKSLNLSDE